MINKNTKSNFPSGFYWGAATSAHQVEGGNINDWSRWEKQNAGKLAKKAGRHWNVQHKKKFPEMLNPENYISGKACDHYNHYEEDFDIAKKLGHNAHRFSIEWSRIEPEEGKFNQNEIEHYRKVIRALKERNLEPFVTLWHFTCPTWFADQGGWLSKKAVFYFTRYVEKVVSELGSDVKFWITINEPVTYSLCMYLEQRWIFNKFSAIKCLRQINVLKNIHKETYKIIKKHNPGLQVGVANNHNYFLQLVRWCPFEWVIVAFLKWFKNMWFLNKIKDHVDFVGVNYHRGISIGLTFGFLCNKKEKTDMGWEICPEGIYHVLKDLKKYKKPVYILENGLADADDSKRAKFIKDHLTWVKKAIDKGVDVRGYFHWSLLDNFEWTLGFWPRFGLVEVDRNTMKRKIKNIKEISNQKDKAVK